MKHDLNDLQAFVAVAKANGFTNASRETGLPRATLSRRVTSLENALRVKLIERTSRSFRLTHAGDNLFKHAAQAVDDAVASFSAIFEAGNNPQGLVRFAVAPSVLNLQLDKMVAKYLSTYPDVQIQIDVTNRRVDIYREAYDFAIRAKEAQKSPLDLVVMPLMKVDHYLVASPKWRQRFGDSVEATLRNIPALTVHAEGQEYHWSFNKPDGTVQRLLVHPRLSVGDMHTLKIAAIEGVGITILPDFMAKDALASGDLIALDLDLKPLTNTIHAIHSGHKGMRPVVRHFLDWIATSYRHC